MSTSDFPARQAQRLKVSFEFSPPRTEAAERTLWETITRLAPLKPTFFSVTYGAGGSTRQRTHETVARLKNETGIDAADGEHLLVADGAEAMASSVERLFDDLAMADRMGKAARERMVARYGWDARLAPLRELLGLEG